MSLGSCRGQPLGSRQLSACLLPGRRSAMTTQAPPEAVVQFPPLTEDRGSSVTSKQAMSPEEEHELGLKRSHWSSGVRQVWRAHHKREGRRTPVALPTTKGTHSPPGGPLKSLRGLPAGWARQSGSHSFQAWSPQLCDPDHPSCSGAQATCETQLSLACCPPRQGVTYTGSD